MMDQADVAGGTDARERVIALDPFGYVGNHASRIRGLGGEEAFHDPAYTFHTPYVAVNRGPARFTLRFRNLEARRGTLTVRIGMQPDEEGAQARLIDSERIQLNRLIALNGTMSIAFESYSGVRFALLGHIFDGTDASADGLEIILEQSEQDEASAAIVVEARTTEYGQRAARPVAKLLSTARAVFTDPVSQLCTDPQFAEPAYAEWAARLGEPVRHDRRQWERCYTLQALARYGVLVDGARGLALGDAPGPLPAIVAAHGCRVVATHDADDETPFRRAEILAAAEFDRSVTLRRDAPDALPPDLVNFDFLWACGLFERFDSAGAGTRFVERTMGALRPGGLAVYTGSYDLASLGDMMSGRGGGIFRRRDVERLALMFISRGHEVAQFKIDAGRTGQVHEADATGGILTSFAIIARKATSLI